MLLVRPGLLDVLHIRAPSSAFSRDDFPTLLRPRKATSGAGLGLSGWKSIVRNSEALQRNEGVWAVKKASAKETWESGGGVEGAQCRERLVGGILGGARGGGCGAGDLSVERTLLQGGLLRSWKHVLPI
jgi:hypothetical protein